MRAVSSMQSARLVSEKMSGRDRCGPPLTPAMRVLLTTAVWLSTEKRWQIPPSSGRSWRTVLAMHKRGLCVWVGAAVLLTPKGETMRQWLRNAQAHAETYGLRRLR